MKISSVNNMKNHHNTKSKLNNVKRRDNWVKPGIKDRVNKFNST